MIATSSSAFRRTGRDREAARSDDSYSGWPFVPYRGREGRRRLRVRAPRPRDREGTRRPLRGRRVRASSRRFPGWGALRAPPRTRRGRSCDPRAEHLPGFNDRRDVPPGGRDPGCRRATGDGRGPVLRLRPPGQAIPRGRGDLRQGDREAPRGRLRRTPDDGDPGQPGNPPDVRAPHPRGERYAGDRPLPQVREGRRAPRAGRGRAPPREGGVLGRRCPVRLPREGAHRFVHGEDRAESPRGPRQVRRHRGRRDLDGRHDCDGGEGAEGPRRPAGHRGVRPRPICRRGRREAPGLRRCDRDGHGAVEAHEGERRPGVRRGGSAVSLGRPNPRKDRPRHVEQDAGPYEEAEVLNIRRPLGTEAAREAGKGRKHRPGDYEEVAEPPDGWVPRQESDEDGEVDPRESQGVQREHVPAGEHSFDRRRVEGRPSVRRRWRGSHGCTSIARWPRAYKIMMRQIYIAESTPLPRIHRPGRVAAESRSMANLLSRETPSRRGAVLWRTWRSGRSRTST